MATDIDSRKTLALYQGARAKLEDTAAMAREKLSQIAGWKLPESNAKDLEAAEGHLKAAWDYLKILEELEEEDKR